MQERLRIAASLGAKASLYERASSLPANTAIIGSWRNSSWSLRILIAKCDGEHPLADQRRDLVLDQFPSRLVVKGTSQTDPSVRSPDPSRAKAKPPASRHQPGIKRGLHSAAFNRSKIKMFGDTLCRHRGFQSRCGTT